MLPIYSTDLAHHTIAEHLHDGLNLRTRPILLLQFVSSNCRRGFTSGQGGGNCPLPKPEHCPPKSSVTAAVCSIKTCKQRAFWRVGVVDLV